MEGNRDRTPSISDRLLTFLRELIRCDDAGEEVCYDLLKAAGGCRNDKDLMDLRRHAAEQGWVGSPEAIAVLTEPVGKHGIRSDQTISVIKSLNSVNLSARIHVEERG